MTKIPLRLHNKIINICLYSKNAVLKKMLRKVKDVNYNVKNHHLIDYYRVS